MKKVLVVGTGFIGRAVADTLGRNYEVYGASLHAGTGERQLPIDLRDRSSIRKVLEAVKPELVVNCAGIVGGPGADLNIAFTSNILEAIAALDLSVERLIVSGSAAEYGRVNPADLPVNEDVPLRADAGYGLSKVTEERTALMLGRKHEIPIVVARVFNPVGPHMGPKFLVSAVLRQIDAIRAGTADTIEVSRLDSERDYIHVDDIACAYEALLGGNLSHEAYNIGSGNATTNYRLVQCMLETAGLPDVEITETVADKEPQIATQADIKRIHSELGWKPRVSLEDAIRSIVYGR